METVEIVKKLEEQMTQAGISQEQQILALFELAIAQKLKPEILDQLSK